jgi:hypothetical protein
MFEQALSSTAIEVVRHIKDGIRGFYLSGGTGLALHLGHRRSEDLDFFSRGKFDVHEISDYIKPEKISIIRSHTLHCVKNGVKLTFLFNDIDLVFPTILWNRIKVAAWEDIVSDKLKTISQRGAKKDFYDLYAAIIIKSTIPDICDYFLRRFGHTGINLYHVLKSLVYFKDAEEDPEPVLMVKDDRWEWRNVKKFFEGNIKEFEEYLIR